MDSWAGIGKEILLDLNSQKAVGKMLKRAAEDNDIDFVSEISKSVYSFLKHEKNIKNMKNNIHSFISHLPGNAKDSFVEKMMTLSHVEEIFAGDTEILNVIKN